MKKLAGIISISLIWVISNGQSSADSKKVMEYLQEQQYEEAISYLRTSVNVSDARQLALLAYTYMQAGKISEAADTYTSVLTLDSNYIPALQYLGHIRLQQELYTTATALYKRLVQLRPQHAYSWKQLSFAALAAQQTDSGFIWLQTAWRLNPADAKVTARLAEEWLDRKQYDKADSLVSAFIVRDSMQTNVLMTAVKTSFFKKNYDRTTALGKQLQRMQVISPNTFAYVSTASYILKQYEDCIALYDYLKANNAASEHITYYAALGAAALQRYTQSNELLHLCIGMARSATLESYYNSAAANYESLKQYKTAIAYLDTSYYLSRRPLRQYSIGRIQETAFSNEAAAMKYYRRYMQLYKPGTTEENEIYRYLRSRLTK
ncbi:tetratricopeptide repeat protein [Chitinophaga solisilvae]|uniref:tetratricopeptide repeat protein n=1 Tax=Chitinophaga solisilvae TaxID=1233460 RepID=UPI001370170F|nr:hypothetical protein [Chitinophaga solisilvae]